MPRRTDATISNRRDSYHVTIPGEKPNGKGYSDGVLALIAAQVRATGSHGLPPVTTPLEVVRQSLFGPAVCLYRVERDDDGVVLTHKVNGED
jgi:hypothetical protein